ncbi:RTA1-domain-containing protein [Bimuria novae-zelandiae CBS 107.79]|uniref:RTA1-domain-containing protein n=1 Tax=Bimuria novae-zelandiae CBS 107.79 TaxID=1447943 RepID=A0A6A5VNL5_9PLEO|nr:RTA1-domain-containing protein [Bimuria novae-zelandiae CBS 107.79]
MAGDHPNINNPNRFILYRYNPSLPAAIIFVVLFALSTFYHIFQIGRKRTWYFIPLAVGGAFEFVGYIGRAQSHFDQWKLGPFIMQSLLLLVAPALFAASIYIILGRIILLTDGEKHSLIRQKWLTKIFVAGDVLSFLVQSGGAGIQASGSTSSMKTGEKLIIVGLFIQLTFFGFFVTVAAIFHLRLHKYGTISTAVNLDELPWKRHLVALYVSSGLILVRSIFRVIEYIGGNAGYLLRHEVFLYIFDGVLMLGVLLVFNYIHPSEVTQLYHQRITAEKGTHSRDASDIEMVRPKEGREVPGGPW